MDVLTHALLGASISYALFHKQLARMSMWIGAIAGMAPDLDAFIYSSQDPTVFMTYHRHFTHALLFIPVGGLLVAGILLLSFRKLRPKWRYVCLACVAAFASHILLDACTSYGTLLFWPFTDWRVAWDVISIVDPIFTAILIIGLVLAYRREKAWPTLYALIACLLYLGFGFFQHYRAMSVQEELAQSRHQTITQGRVIPNFGTLLGFDSVYISGQQIYLDAIQTPLFGPATAAEGIIAPLITEKLLPSVIKNNPILLQDFRVFDWFTDGYITALQENPIVLVDLRYVSSIVPLQTLWGIQFPEKGDKRRHVYWVNQ